MRTSVANALAPPTRVIRPSWMARRILACVLGDMSPRTQAKILRAIQDGRITRVGGAKAFATDVRIVAATNRDLPAMIRAGTFREDLYFRLAVVPLVVPPLSERPADVPRLATHFAERLARRRARRSAKWVTRRGTSSGRSERGGTTSGTTASRK